MRRSIRELCVKFRRIIKKIFVHARRCVLLPMFYIYTSTFDPISSSFSPSSSLPLLLLLRLSLPLVLLILLLLLILPLTDRPGTPNLLNYIPERRIVNKETTSARLLLAGT